MRDKEVDSSLSVLNDGMTEFIFTTVKDNPRAATAEELMEKTAPLALSAVAEDSIEKALRIAKEKGRPTLIVGSLYLYKDVMCALAAEPALFCTTRNKNSL
jgi:folylpolyglutamate synthase/dihydropteroate synthase